MIANTYHHSILKKPINVNYSALTEKIETNHIAPKFKVNDRVRVTKYKNNFSKGYTENWSRAIFRFLDLENQRFKRRKKSRKKL